MHRDIKCGPFSLDEVVISISFSVITISMIFGAH
jgi:hypothetical protein